MNNGHNNKIRDEAMNDLLMDPKSALITVLGILMGVLAWIGKGALNRLEHLEQNAVTKDDMDKRHEENIDRLDRIETAVTGTHKRIDDLYRDLMGKES